MTDDGLSQLALETSCFVRARPERVFEAWTTPSELMKWWGPTGVRCIDAEINLQVGGRYRIANRLPDRSVLWIRGEFEEIVVPERLVYSWRIADDAVENERVTVRFLAEDSGTRVVVRHERIGGSALRDQHLEGWLGCLSGLSGYFSD